MHNVPEAQNYADRALKEHPEWLDTKVLQIEMLQALGKRNAAAQGFDNFWHKFGYAFHYNRNGSVSGSAVAGHDGLELKQKSR